MARVLLCGESHINAEQHFKGFNNLFTTSYKSFADLLRVPLEARGHSVTHMPAHEVANEFPFESEGLRDFDVVLISDVSSDAFLLHPDTWRFGEAKPNRLKMLRSWVESGRGLAMLGGWMSFSGYLGQGRYCISPIAPILPVEILPYDDRVEIPEGAKAEVSQADHPVVQGLNKSVWPDLMGYNRTTVKSDGKLLATLNGDPLIVVGQAGKGRTLAWTSDVGPAWCPARFSDWEGYGQVFSQAVSWLAGES